MTDRFLDPFMFKQTLRDYVYSGPPIFANSNMPIEKPCRLPMEKDILAYHFGRATMRIAALSASLIKYNWDIIRAHLPQSCDFKQLSFEILALYAFIYSTTGVICYPLRYVRARLATDVKTTSEFRLSFDSGIRLGSSNIAKVTNGRQFSGMIGACKSTMKSDGIHGFYRGYTISCIVGILVFDLLTRTRNTSREMHKNNKLWNALQIYFLAEIVPLVLYPFDSASKRMMMSSGNTSKYKGAIDAFRHIVKPEGFLSLYIGAGTFIVHRHVKTILVLVLTNSAIIGLQKFEKLLEKASRR